MFSNKDNRYGVELTQDQLKEFKLFIKNLKGKERNMLCEGCHSKHGCSNDHDIYLTDTGVCSICGINTDVINCSIANKVELDDIPVKSYWNNGERIVMKENIMDNKTIFISEQLKFSEKDTPLFSVKEFTIYGMSSIFLLFLFAWFVFGKTGIDKIMLNEDLEIIYRMLFFIIVFIIMLVLRQLVKFFLSWRMKKI